MAKRRTLTLSNGGRFVFTPKTVSLDVGKLFDAVAPGDRRILHVGRTKSALESAASVDEIRLEDAVELLRREDSRRILAGEPSVETLFDRRLWLTVQRHAGQLAAMRLARTPLHGRKRVFCLESRGGHPGEFLWIDRETGESELETRTVETDDKGRPAGFATRSRIVSPADALRWIETDGAHFIPEGIYLVLRLAAAKK